MPNRKRQHLLVYGLFMLFYVAGALYAMSYYLQNSYLNDKYYRATYTALMDGSAARPFVFRRLVPIVTNAIVEVTPQDIRSSVSGSVEVLKRDWQYRGLRVFLPWLSPTLPNPVQHYQRVVTMLLIFASLMGYMCLTYLLGLRLFPESPAVALCAPLFAVIAFTSSAEPLYYIYDIPQLLLSSACFYCLLRERFRGYVFVFALACINRETAIYTLAFFTLWALPRMGNRQFFLLWFLQLVIFLIVKTVISLNYIANINSIYNFLDFNAASVITRDVLAKTSLHKALLVMMLFFLLTFRWNEKPAFLKTSLWIIPCIYAAYIFFGWPHEYRIFFDIHAPLVLLMTHTLVVGTGVAASPVFASLNAVRREEEHAATP